MTKLFNFPSPHHPLQKVVVIVGPTASGKTALSIQIAKAVSGEVISADSRQVYRGLTIGTGKITKKEMRSIPHHLLDVANPKNSFTASDYVRLGRSAIGDIGVRNHVPIIVGGTGFYIDTLLGLMGMTEVPANQKLRKKLSTYSLEKLNALLFKLDPERTKTIDQKNSVRLVRAIEIAKTLGRMPTIESKPLYKILFIGVTLPKEKLDEKIHSRLYARMQAGMLNEARRLHKKGLSWKRMEELGLEYRYMAHHLQGKISREEMLQKIEIEIRKYAKRQMTWFRKNKAITWFSPKQKKEIVAFTKTFLRE